MAGKTFKCLDCGASITKTQASVQCKRCAQWLHASCVGIPEKELDLVKSCKFLKFTCPTCEKNPGTNEERTLRDEISEMNNKFDAFIKSNDDERNAVKQSLLIALQTLSMRWPLVSKP